MTKPNRRDIKEISFAELFDSRSFYVIPLYQRSYSWDNENLVSLWEDIEHTRIQQAKSGELRSHFMSSILVKESIDKREDRKGNTYHIVDGQQRITTAYIALKAADDVLKNNQELFSDEYIEQLEYLSDRLTEVLYGKSYDRSAKKKITRPRLSLESAVENNPFNVLMNQGASKWNASHRGSKVVDAYDFFHSKYTGLLKTLDPTVFNDTITVILDDLQMVFIPLENHEAPQKIFESVNGLTKKLYAGELIKNYLLMSLANEKDSNTIYKQYWAEFDHLEWNKREEDKENFTKLLYYWVRSHGMKTKTNDEHVYRSFKQLVALNSLNPEAAAEKAEKVSASLYKIITTLKELEKNKTKPRGRLEKSYSRIYAADAYTANSRSVFILFLQHISDLESHYGTKLTDIHLDKLLLPLESYIIRKVISTGYNEQKSTFLVTSARSVFVIKSFNDYETVDRYLEAKVKEFAKLLSSPDSKALVRFDDNKLILDIMVGSVNESRPPKRLGEKHHGLVRMLLIQTENYLRTNSFNPNGSDVDGNVSVEHWLPQSSTNETWPLKNEKDREIYTNTIGNLCIIPSKINSSLGNQSIEDKVKKVTSILRVDGSNKTEIQTFDKVLELCREDFDVEQKPIWNEIQMEKRANWIMQIVLNHIFKDIEYFTGDKPLATSVADEPCDNLSGDNNKKLF